MSLPVDPFEAGEQPNCPACGTVLREVDGGYECAWDGTTLDVPWVERPTGGDDLPSVHGG